jgi:hypothetical protein
MPSPSQNWSYSRLILFRTFFLWVLLFIISFPAGYHLIPDPGKLTEAFFQSLAKWSGDHLFVIKRNYTAELVSDSTGFYLDFFNTFLLAVLLAGIWTIAFRKIQSHDKLLYAFTGFLRYFLALQLLIYGTSKLFKVQFYLPEPNILNTKLGDLNRDVLYWSTMGVSRAYSIFLGTVELIAAVLLLFRKTSLVGAVFAFFILVNITAINFAYDISVKLFSIFLLILAAYLILQERRRMMRIIPGMNTVIYGPVHSRWDFKNKRIYHFAKFILIAVLIIESLYPYISSGNFNDDQVSRPYFHGVYRVESFVFNNDTLPPLLTDTVRWKRIFFHREGYFIIEKMHEKMSDYRMSVDTNRKEIFLIPYHSRKPMILNYQIPGNSILLDGVFEDMNINVVLRELDWKQMPVIKKEFSWTID